MNNTYQTKPLAFQAHKSDEWNTRSDRRKKEAQYGKT